MSSLPTASSAPTTHQHPPPSYSEAAASSRPQQSTFLERSTQQQSTPTTRSHYHRLSAPTNHQQSNPSRFESALTTDPAFLPRRIQHTDSSEEYSSFFFTDDLWNASPLGTEFLSAEPYCSTGTDNSTLVRQFSCQERERGRWGREGRREDQAEFRYLCTESEVDVMETTGGRGKGGSGGKDGGHKKSYSTSDLPHTTSISKHNSFFSPKINSPLSSSLFSSTSSLPSPIQIGQFPLVPTQSPPKRPETPEGVPSFNSPAAAFISIRNPAGGPPVRGRFRAGVSGHTGFMSRERGNQWRGFSPVYIPTREGGGRGNVRRDGGSEWLVVPRGNRGTSMISPTDATRAIPGSLASTGSLHIIQNGERRMHSVATGRRVAAARNSNFSNPTERQQTNQDDTTLPDICIFLFCCVCCGKTGGRKPAKRKNRKARRDLRGMGGSEVVSRNRGRGGFFLESPTPWRTVR